MSEWKQDAQPSAKMFVKEGERFICEAWTMELAEQIVRDHNSFETLREALEKIIGHGITTCPHCTNFKAIAFKAINQTNPNPPQAFPGGRWNTKEPEKPSCFNCGETIRGTVFMMSDNPHCEICFEDKRKGTP